MKYILIFLNHLQDKPGASAQSCKNKFLFYFFHLIIYIIILMLILTFQVVICRNEAEKCLIETSINSLRISLKVITLNVQFTSL